MLSRLRLVVQDVAPPGPQGDSPWERYEAAKKVIGDTAQSAAEYEARLRKVAAELGL